MAWQKATAQTVMVVFYAAGEPITPTGALTATISKDGAGFGAIGGSIALVAGTPVALLTLNTADTNCDTGVVKIVDAGATADDRYEPFVTEANYTAAVAARIDDTISSRGTSTYAGADTTGTTTLLARVSETRLAELDAVNLPATTDDIKTKTDTIPASPAAVGSAMTLTAGERTAIAVALLAATVTFPDGTTMTVEEILEEVWANNAGDWSLSGLNWTIRWPDAATAAMVFVVDDTDSPTFRTRT